MSLIYTVIGKEDKFLSQYTAFSGNFVLTVQQIIRLCSPQKTHMKYAANNYVFYVLYSDIIYLVMCDFKYSERIAFAYLQRIKTLFTASYSQARIKNAKMLQFMEFGSVIKDNMQLYNSPEQVDNVAMLWKQTEEVSQIVNEDLQKVINRGEKIQILVKKTQQMASLSLDLSSSAKTVKHEMIWRNWKATLLIVLAVILAVYILMVIFCGGFTLSGCF